MAELNATAPSLPLPPDEYDRRYFDQLTNILRLYFNQLNNPGDIGGSTLNLNLETLPTQANLANLRSGDVYRDTTAANVLKIKV